MGKVKKTPVLEHLLVGVDDRDETADALALVRYLARRTGAKVTALAAYPFKGVPPAQRDEILELESADLFSRVRDALDGIEVETRAVCDNSPAHALCLAAELSGPDLIVIGSSGRSRLGRVLLGATGERLFHGAPCPVAVAPRGYAGRPHLGMGLIGVGYIDAPEARNALERALGLSSQLDARLRLITVFDRIGPGPGYRAYPLHGEEELKADQQRAMDLLGEAVDADSQFLVGDPAAALSEAGVALDLLVLGSRGYGTFARTLLGGVSAAVTRTAPCPVVVVPRAAERAHAEEEPTAATPRAA
jgi:nucleotide-binding universal stress UspA family protein